MSREDSSESLETGFARKGEAMPTPELNRSLETDQKWRFDVPSIKLVRKADHLLCEEYVWEKTAMLGRSFGWKPKSKRLLGYPEVVGPRLTVSDQEARSLSQAIQDCFDTLKSGRRPTRRQISHLLLLGEGWDGNTFFVGLAEPMRIADFCRGGRLHIESV